MRIMCDTHVLLYWSDARERLSAPAHAALAQGIASNTLACCDISLWEIAMLFAKGRLRADVDPLGYLNDILEAMSLEVLPVTASIAVLAQSEIFPHRDPADRLIAATAIHYQAPLITCDQHLRGIPGIQTIW